MANPKDDEQLDQSPATLVAIARAAHIAGDQDLERAARRQLDQRFAIKIQFGISLDRSRLRGPLA